MTQPAERSATTGTPDRTCPLCGATWSASAPVWACQECPLARGCRLARCPRCGYEWPEGSRLVAWLIRRWKAWRCPHPPEPR